MLFLSHGWFFAKIEKINKLYLLSASTAMLHICFFALNVLHELHLVSEMVYFRFNFVFSCHSCLCFPR